MFSVFLLRDDVLKKTIRLESYFTFMKDFWWSAHTTSGNDILLKYMMIKQQTCITHV